MKKLLQITLTLTLIAFACSSFAQKKIKEGVVKFEMANSDDDSPEMAMLAGTTLAIYFTETMQKMDMNMMGGLMRVQTVTPNDKLDGAFILMDMMGQKFQIVDLSEDQIGEKNFGLNMGGIEKVVYDEKDKKEIAGFKCYRANATMKEGMNMVYYITEKIQPPVFSKQNPALTLKGYPLEMVIDTGQGISMTFTATEVLRQVDTEVFKAPKEGYKKMTMAEFETQMGNLSGFGN